MRTSNAELPRPHRAEEKCEHRTLNAEHCLRLGQLGLRRISPNSLALAPRSTLNGGGRGRLILDFERGATSSWFITGQQAGLVWRQQAAALLEAEGCRPRSVHSGEDWNQATAVGRVSGVGRKPRV